MRFFELSTHPNRELRPLNESYRWGLYKSSSLQDFCKPLEISDFLTNKKSKIQHPLDSIHSVPYIKSSKKAYSKHFLKVNFYILVILCDY